ncbi:penicillin-binding protein activator [Magnetovibrio sp.]|uniref:penicillin-binding protein activator n=1 Tax=Magnetovibrio sp. TaxID=2024836 RepID=UPI002F954818
MRNVTYKSNWRRFRAGIVIACVSVALAGCEQAGFGTKPKLAVPPQTQQTAKTPGQQPDHTSHAASAGVGPQVVNRPADAPLPRPPLLPSLDDLIGRIPQATTQGGVGGEMAEPPSLPGARGLRVAILLPLSGANQRVGSAMLNAAQMALFEFSGNDFELLVHDTQGTPEGAAEAARLAIGDGAQLIIGPLLSTSVRAVADQARAASVPVVAFSSDRTVAGEGVYTMGFFPGDEVKRVVDFAASKGAQRFALLAPEGAYGDAVSAAYNAAVWQAGGFVVQSEFYPPQVSDFSEPVKRIAHFDERRAALLDQRRILEERGDEVSLLALKRLENLQTLGEVPFDALLLADGGKRLIAVAALLPFYDVDPKKVKILGTGQWDEAGLGAEPALVGGWFAAPDPSARRAFSDKYLTAYGNRPHRLATLAYDATALAVVLGAQQVAQPYGVEVLAQAGGFAGRDGIFRFTPAGAAERGLAVMQVERKDASIVDPAPKAFP